MIAYSYLIKKGACKEHLDYIYKGLISHYQHAKLHCNTLIILYYSIWQKKRKKRKRHIITLQLQAIYLYILII